MFCVVFLFFLFFQGAKKAFDRETLATAWNADIRMKNIWKAIETWREFGLVRSIGTKKNRTWMHATSCNRVREFRTQVYNILYIFGQRSVFFNCPRECGSTAFGSIDTASGSWYQCGGFPQLLTFSIVNFLQAPLICRRYCMIWAPFPSEEFLTQGSMMSFRSPLRCGEAMADCTVLVYSIDRC